MDAVEVDNCILWKRTQNVLFMSCFLIVLNFNAAFLSSADFALNVSHILDESRAVAVRCGSIVTISMDCKHWDVASLLIPLRWM